MYLTPCTNSEIINIIKNLRECSPGFDQIPAKILKATTESIIDPFVHIINLSLQQGVFPQQMKIANVIPLFKSGEMNKFSNYRPVSLLTTFSKVLEKVFYNKILSFLKECKTLYEFQFGFREGHTTAMALIASLDKVINALEKQETTLGVFLDFSKAFDTVNHTILLQKLEYYGVRGVSNKWVNSYLTGRKQFCTYGNSQSEMKNIVCGVPQGSILGPLLFLIYINDLGSISDDIRLIMFADDSNMFLSGKNLREIEIRANSALEQIKKWLQVNRLSLNIDKTNYMIFTTKARKKEQNLNIKINDKTISEVNTCKFLGIIVDNRLKWTDHINALSTKISKSIGIISKTRKYLGQKTLLQLYYSFVYPYLLYGNLIWGNAGKTLLDKVEKKQKLAIRLIFNIRRKESVTAVCKKKNIIKLKDLYHYTLTIFMHKLCHEELPSLFNVMFTVNNEVHDYPTRIQSHLHVPIYKTAHGNNFITKTGTQRWNEVIETGFRYSPLGFLKIQTKAEILAKY